LEKKSINLSHNFLQDIDWKVSLQGIVTTAGVELEEMLRRLLVAFSGAGFIKTDELAQKLKKASLGTLCDLLGKYSIEQKTVPETIQKFFKPFIQIRDNFLKILRDLIPLRNTFSHSRSGEDRELPDVILIEKARELVQGALKALEILEPVYPITVRPRSMELTPAHGNRWLMDADPTGIEEIILSPEVIISNDRDYFLFTDTNPVRMYPLLVQFRLE